MKNVNENEVVTAIRKDIGEVEAVLSDHYGVDIVIEFDSDDGGVWIRNTKENIGVRYDLACIFLSKYYGIIIRTMFIEENYIYIVYEGEL